jgi:hypothetical protein
MGTRRKGEYDGRRGRERRRYGEGKVVPVLN